MTVQEATQMRELWRKHLADAQREAEIWDRQIKVVQATLAEAEAELAAAVLREGGDR